MAGWRTAFHASKRLLESLRNTFPQFHSSVLCWCIPIHHAHVLSQSSTDYEASYSSGSFRGCRPSSTVCCLVRSTRYGLLFDSHTRTRQARLYAEGPMQLGQNSLFRSSGSDSTHYIPGRMCARSDCDRTGATGRLSLSSTPCPALPCNFA